MTDLASPETRVSQGMTLSLGKEFEDPGHIIRAAQRVGLFGSRNMFWFKDEAAPSNFGDWIGPLLFEARTGRRPYWCHIGHSKIFGSVFFTVGSILDFIAAPDRATVWGSGIIRRNAEFSRPRAIHAVRGPLSRARSLELGYACPEVYGDPAILLPRYLPARSSNPTYRLGMIPHFVHMDEARQRLPDSDEVLLIDVMRPVPEVCRDICNCACTVSSSLHGLIVSHAFGVPSAWISLTAPLYGDGVKFHDYYSSAGICEPAQHCLDDGEFDIESLVETARAAPMPDLADLHEGLLKSCPF